MSWTSCLCGGNTYDDYFLERESLFPSAKSNAYPKVAQMHKNFSSNNNLLNSKYMAKVKCELRPSALKPLEAYILVWDWHLKKWIRQDVGELEYRYEAKRNVDTPDKELDFWKNGGRFGARKAPYPLHQNLLTGTLFRTD